MTFPLGPEGGASLSRPPSGAVLTPFHWSSEQKVWMYTGTLINDLFGLVEKVEKYARSSPPQDANAGAGHAALHAGRDGNASSESEQLAQALGLGPADRNLALLLVVHAQLVGTLEPGNDFANAVDVDQIGAMGPPEKIRV